MSEQRLVWTTEKGEQVSISLSIHSPQMQDAIKDLHRGLLKIGRDDAILQERHDAWRTV